MTATQPTTVRLPADLAERLDEHATATGRTRGDVLAELVAAIASGQIKPAGSEAEVRVNFRVPRNVLGAATERLEVAKRSAATRSGGLNATVVVALRDLLDHTEVAR